VVATGVVTIEIITSGAGPQRQICPFPFQRLYLPI